MKTQLHLDSFGFLTCEFALRSRAGGGQAFKPIPTHICLTLEPADAPMPPRTESGEAEYAEAMFEAQEAAA